MAETLTKAQRAAVENRGGPLLVAAAAGSGKTKVLVDRLMGYLCQAQDPANLDEFLIITYTRAAASGFGEKSAPGSQSFWRSTRKTVICSVRSSGCIWRKSPRSMRFAGSCCGNTPLPWSCPEIFG